MESLILDHENYFYIMAGLLLIIELAGAMTCYLMFLAIGSFITGLIISFGLVSSWELELLTLAIVTSIVTASLWKPMKKFQNSGDGKDDSSDMIGRKVLVGSDITSDKGTIRFSGADWNSRLVDGLGTTVIPEGDYCIIAEVDGNVMVVKPV